MENEKRLLQKTVPATQSKGEVVGRVAADMESRVAVMSSMDEAEKLADVTRAAAVGELELIDNATNLVVVGTLVEMLSDEDEEFDEVVVLGNASDVAVPETAVPRLMSA